jgi:hypothetical protein
MSTQGTVNVTVTKVVAAQPETVYDLVADITRMPTYSPENTAGEWLDGAVEAVVGARFKGSNQLGRAKWSTKPTVTVADRGREFAFKVPGAAGAQWTYRFESMEFPSDRGGFGLGGGGRGGVDLLVGDG